MAERYNSGAAWRNEDKKSENSPGYSGTVNVGGVLYFIDVWVKQGQHENKFLSFSFKKREKQEGAAQLDNADDIPQ